MWIKERFRKLCLKYEDAVAKVDEGIAEKLHNELMRLKDKAEEAGVSSRFFSFIDDGNQYVSLWACAFSLKYLPEKAAAKLAELAKLDAPISISASAMLQIWKKGLM